ncbi:MAG: hypothetical protein Q7R88_00960, partial [bacterium]|nr:hypothetical protein [bacterium]
MQEQTTPSRFVRIVQMVLLIWGILHFINAGFYAIKIGLQLDYWLSSGYAILLPLSVFGTLLV